MGSHVPKERQTPGVMDKLQLSALYCRWAFTGRHYGLAHGESGQMLLEWGLHRGKRMFTSSMYSLIAINYLAQLEPQIFCSGINFLSCCSFVLFYFVQFLLLLLFKGLIRKRSNRCISFMEFFSALRSTFALKTVTGS